jgi:hypothetical protein
MNRRSGEVERCGPVFYHDGQLQRPHEVACALRPETLKRPRRSIWPARAANAGTTSRHEVFRQGATSIACSCCHNSELYRPGSVSLAQIRCDRFWPSFNDLQRSASLGYSMGYGSSMMSVSERILYVLWKSECFRFMHAMDHGGHTRWIPLHDRLFVKGSVEWLGRWPMAGAES